MRSVPPLQQQLVDEVQWRAFESKKKAEMISNQEENSMLECNCNLPGDVRAMWPPGPGPALLLLSIQDVNVVKRPALFSPVAEEDAKGEPGPGHGL